MPGATGRRRSCIAARRSAHRASPREGFPGGPSQFFCRSETSLTTPRETPSPAPRDRVERAFAARASSPHPTRADHALPSPLSVAQYHQYHIVGHHVPTDADPSPQVYRMKLWSLDDTRAKSKFWCVLSPSFGPIGSDARRERGEWASAWRPGARSPGPSEYFDRHFFLGLSVGNGAFF